MKAATQGSDDQLLKVVIEQLKVPLIHIASQSELAQTKAIDSYSEINSIANMAINLIDSYLLAQRDINQATLNLEPVSIASILHKAAHNVEPIAKLYNCDIELKLAGKYGPVIGQKDSLETAFTMLTYSFVEAHMSHSSKSKVGRIILHGYRTPHGLSAGIFSPNIEINAQSFAKAINNFGKGRQGVPDISPSTGAGIFIANTILDNFSSKLRVAHYKKLSGLAATLVPSQQLQFV